jgi:hypothetical protein
MPSTTVSESFAGISTSPLLGATGLVYLTEADRQRLPFHLWIWAASCAAVLVGAVASTYADAVLDRPFDARFWRLLLLQPALVVYWVAALPIVRLVHRRAVTAVRRIVAVPAHELDRRLAAHRAASRWRFWLCIGVGVLAGQALIQPWSGSTDTPRVYVFHWLTTIAVWGLIGGFIGETLNGAQLLGRLQRERLTLDLFDPTPLLPVAQWGLSLVLGFVGAASIAAIAILDEDVLRSYGVRSLTIYALMSATATSLFFLAVWESHRVLTRMKRLELAEVTSQLSVAHARLRRALATNDANIGALAADVATWASLRQRIRDVSDWPFNTTTLRNLGAALLAPAGAAALRAYVDLR